MFTLFSIGPDRSIIDSSSSSELRNEREKISLSGDLSIGMLITIGASAYAQLGL